MALLLNFRDIKFLYLRTKYDVAFADDAILKLGIAMRSGSAHRRVRLLQQRRNAVAWDNGFVLAVSSRESVEELANTMRSGLGDFDSWALLGYCGEWVEPHGEGPVSMFMNQAGASGFLGRPSQIFLMFSSRERDPEDVTEKLRGRLGVRRSRTVFHFDDGRILLCASEEPARLLSRRAESALSRLYTWSILDTSGEALFRDPTGDWSFADLDELAFGD